MPHRVRVPDSCADLCPAKVERTLEKHFGDITAAARELGVPGPDLRRLTWAQPSLYKNALEEHELVVQRAVGELIQALDSPNDRRREWAAEKILSSYLARNDPFAPARRGRARAQTNEPASTSSIVLTWAGSDAITPPAAELAAPPISSPPELPRWAGPDPPPRVRPICALGAVGSSTAGGRGEPLTWATIFVSSSVSLQSEHFPHTQNTA